MKKTIGSRLLSIALTAFMAVSCVTTTAVPLRASAVTGDAVADASTKDSWQNVLNLNNNPSNVGKVWADKSVEVGADNNFKHTFSLLGSSDKESNNKFAEPLDIMFILDISYSMASDDTDYGGKENNARIINSALALNEAMKMIMEDENASPYNRVGLVTYHTIAETTMNLGRYEPNSSGNYFTASNNEKMTITAQPDGDSGGSISSTTIKPPKVIIGSYTEGYTNTQAGLYQGMHILEEAEETSFWVDADGKKVTDPSAGIKELHRQPIIILISDGVPTRMSSSESWWSPVTNDINSVYGGKINNAYPELSMVAMATGSYMRNIVDAHYEKTTPKVYTFGLELPTVGSSGGVTDVTDGVSKYEEDLAKITLDPKRLEMEEYSSLEVVTAKADDKKYYESGGKYGDDHYFTGINVLWEQYNKGNAIINTYRDSILGFREHEYKMTHPSNDITTLNYVDEFIDVKNATDLTSNLQSIVGTLAEETIVVPIEGDVTYTDPIGKYMEVKSVDTLELFGQSYSLTNDGSGNYQVANNTTVSNPAYDANEGAFNLTDIKIGVVTDVSGNQTVRVDVPAVAMPLWIANDNGAYTTDGVQPLRVTYTVGMADAYLTDGAVDLSKIDNDYIAANTAGDKVYFYSNLYTSNTNGDAKVTFSPSVSNNYYVSNTNAESFNKSTNSTGTASTYYSSSVQGSIVNISNGNNGRLAVNVPKSPDNTEPPSTTDPPATTTPPAVTDPPAVTSGPSVFKTEISAGGNTVSKENGNLNDTNSDWLIGPNVKKSDEIIYNISWDNSKSGKTLTSITITDALDAGLELTGAGFTGDEITACSEWHLDSSTNTYTRTDGSNKIVYESSTNKVTWTINAPSDTGAVALKVKVKSSAVSRIVNDAEVTFNYGSNGTKTLNTNRVENPLLGSLAIEKEIQSTEIDPEKEFFFEVVLDIPSITAETKELTCANPDGTSDKVVFSRKDGKYSATITLKHGEKILIYDLPYGTVFEVTETASDGYYLKNITNCSKGAKYDTSYKKVYGTITEENASAYMKFVNAPITEYPETGGTGVRWIYFLGMVLMLTAGLLVYNTKRNQYKQFENN